MSGLVAQWCHAQLLSGTPATSPEGVARQLLAVQAQDPRGARLAVRARTAGLTARDVDRALTDDRSLVVSWLNRGTLHLVCVEDLPMLHALSTPPLKTGNARRLQQEGVSLEQAERGVRVVVDAVRDGPKTRPELRALLESADVPVAGQALVHVLMRTTLLGHVVRGPVVGSEHAYVLTREWLGEQPTPDLDAAVVELARRYLVGHGPASDRDLARWAGIPLGQARRGLAGLRGLHEHPDGRVSLTPPAAPELPGPKLLGPFDPLLLGWTDRTPVVSDHGELVTVNGLFRAFALARGTAVATWSMSGSIDPFSPLAPDVAAALDAELVDVRRFLGSSRYR